MIAAIETLEIVLAETEVNPMEDLLVIIAIDNTAAKVTAGNGYYLKDIEVCGRFVELYEKLSAKRVTVLSAQVPTNDEAADEPSRDKPLDRNRCDGCRRLLETFLLTARRENKTRRMKLARYF